jgi:hypothetical protein
VPRGFRSAVFQSVNELLVNVCKHADARSAVISADATSELEVRICVRDDGHGFDGERAAQRGFGLFSIERRMAHLHGRLDIDSATASGTTATLTLPIAGTVGDDDPSASLAAH